MRAMLFTCMVSMVLLGGGPAAAQPAGGAAEAAAPEPVATRARVVSVDVATGSDKPRYIRLQLVPRARLPFSTLTFRVRDAALVSGITPGIWVQFKAERQEGENTLTSIHVVAECQRFQTCD
jgi:Cu/Ag efflux protein CusF